MLKQLISYTDSYIVLTPFFRVVFQSKLPFSIKTALKVAVKAFAHEAIKNLSSTVTQLFVFIFLVPTAAVA